MKKTSMSEMTYLLKEGFQVYYRNELWEFMGYRYCKWTDQDPKKYGGMVSSNCKICKGEVKLYNLLTGEYKEMCHGISNRGDCSLLSPAPDFIDEEEFSIS
jgi:hypothetical protein